MSITTLPFPFKQSLGAMLLEYQNPPDWLIANRIFPTLKVDSTEYTYNSFKEETFFSFPKDIEVGRTSQTPSIVSTAEQHAASLKLYALQYPLPRGDKLNPKAFSIDETAHAVKLLNQALDIHFEHSVSQMLRDPATYATTGNVSALTGSAKFSDPSSDPIGFLENIIMKSMVKFNTIIMGEETLLILRRHPKVIKTILGDANTHGRVTAQDILDMLPGVDTLLVGKGFINIAAPGPNSVPNYVQCWEKDIILAKVESVALTSSTYTFGVKAEHKKGREIFDHYDKDMGPYGSDIIRVVHPHCPHIVAPKAGYLIKDAVERIQ